MRYLIFYHSLASVSAITASLRGGDGTPKRQLWPTAPMHEPWTDPPRLWAQDAAATPAPTPDLLESWLDQLGWFNQDPCESQSAKIAQAAITQIETLFNTDLDAAQEARIKELLACSNADGASAQDAPTAVTAASTPAVRACVMAIEFEYGAWKNFCTVVTAGGAVCISFDDAYNMPPDDLTAWINGLPATLPSAINRVCSSGMLGSDLTTDTAETAMAARAATGATVDKC